MSNDIEKFQWSMGNGQCPNCHGCKPGDGWYHSTRVGHKKGCALATVIEKSGLVVEWDRPGRDPTEGEKAFDKNFMGTVTIPWLKEVEERMWRDFAESAVDTAPQTE